MKNDISQVTSFKESMLLTGIGLALFYWICESFMFFFLKPQANFFQLLFGPDLFEVWTRLLVLCLFVIFGSHYQYAFNKRKVAIEALRESEEKYRTILESIEEGCFEADFNGNLTFFNDPLCKILGYTREELAGMNTKVFTTPETTRNMDQILAHIRETGEPVNVTDYDIIQKNGHKTTLELSASLLTDAQSRAVGIRGVLRDVSERKRAEAEKKNLETQLQVAQKMEAIGTLAGGIAHDFNNILMGIQGNASLMLLKIDSSHPNYEKIKNIEKYVQSGTELTRQLLGFARRGRYLVQTTDLNEIIAKSSAMFGRAKKEIQINTQLQDGLWTVEVDQGQFEQVLLNLYVNAWQAMPEGGDLYLQTENVILDEDFVKPYEVEAGKYVKVNVVDTGTGIDKATRERIFEPFFTTKEMGRGTGLGLASVYGIIKGHGGYINVDSEKGRGTTFSFYLPASEKKVPEEQETAVALARGTETILLIDDEEMIIEVGREMLEELGYQVLLATSGKEAIEVYQNNHAEIDLIIMDMIIPGISGGEIFDKLKAINPKVKVLLSSGYSINGQASKTLDRGCDGFIQKPFDVQQLADKIREIMENPQ